MKTKHTKIKNTGIIFEVLTRVLVDESMTLEVKEKSPALKLVKKYFRKGTPLYAELVLYRGLLEKTKLKTETIEVINSYIDSIVDSYQYIDAIELKTEKYNLIREMNTCYGKDNVDSFFAQKIPNYKAYAAAYQLFTYRTNQTPSKLLESRQTVLECLMHGQTQPEYVQQFVSQPKQIRNHGFSRLIELFNEEYSGLNKRQKKILSIIINNPIQLSEHLKTEGVRLISEFKTKMLESDNETAAKLTEITNQLSNMNLKGNFGEVDISLTMKCMKLLDELNEKPA